MEKVRGVSKIILLVFCSLLVLGNNIKAEESGVAEDTLEDLSIVAGTGLGGAVLGLSTLPFKDQPSQHLRHILVGGSIGIIVGVAIIAWGQATKSRDLNFEEASFSSSPEKYAHLLKEDFIGPWKYTSPQPQNAPYLFYFSKTF